ncbi:DUF885 family protein [Sediminibacterium sp.]|uniref:DUF885 family protein n=1 Tax=Sediminibacterium sp. TaxID=1917865 RepID=UPI003F72431D
MKISPFVFSMLIAGQFFSVTLQKATAQVSTASFVPCQEMPSLIQGYNVDNRTLSRYYSPTSSRGGGGFGAGADASIGSPEKNKRLQQLVQDYQKKLAAVSFNNLSQECKADYILFKRDLAERLQQLKNEEAEVTKIQAWIPFAPKVYALEQLRRRGIQPKAEEVARDWSAIAQEIKTLQAKLKQEKSVDPESVYTAGEVINNLRATVQSIQDFYNGYDPMFTWWVPTVQKTLDEALVAYAAAFKAKANSALTATDNSGIVGVQVGRAELIKQLQREMIPYTPEELIEIANKEFAWCDAEMLKASKEMGFGDNWKAALEKVKNLYVPPGKQPEAILKLYTESIDFLKKNQLLTIPPLAEETWGMMMMSPERQLVNPFFTGGADITISYPTNTMSYEDRMMSMRGNNPHFSKATVHHELIAGHNLQQFVNSRTRTYRNFGTPFWTEGWALYWELILWDQQFAKIPEDRIGMLFWHMHRCARIIFSLNYHMKKWTPQQCIDFLVDRVGHERANAEGEVRRSFVGRYPPLYQLAYLTGGRQFYALKKELVDGGKMSYKQYHDAVLSLNAMPVEMVRAILTKQPLTENFTTNWRFYNE